MIKKERVKMKINFTKKEYRTLVDLIFLGDMVVNGIRVGDDNVKEYEELREYIYSFAKQMGCEDIIQFDKEFNQHFETREYDESKVQDYLTEYDNEVFWSEISSRLAMRDIDRTQRISAEEHEPQEVIKKIWSREEVYLKEFEKNGLKNVNVDFQK